MGICALSAYRGDLVQAKAAQAANIPMVLSATSLIRMEDVCAACPGTWFQAYLPAPAKIPRWSIASRRGLQDAGGHGGRRRALQPREQRARGILHRRFARASRSRGRASPIRAGASAHSCARW
jgi:hypothetical protein